MDVVIFNRVRGFVEAFESRDYERARDELKELRDCLEKLITVTTDRNTMNLALSLYMQIPLYEDLIDLRLNLKRRLGWD